MSLNHRNFLPHRMIDHIFNLHGFYLVVSTESWSFLSFVYCCKSVIANIYQHLDTSATLLFSLYSRSNGNYAGIIVSISCFTFISELLANVVVAKLWIMMLVYVKISHNTKWCFRVSVVPKNYSKMDPKLHFCYRYSPNHVAKNAR